MAGRLYASGPDTRPAASSATEHSRLYSPRRDLLAISRGREPTDPEGAMPWPLVREESAAFENAGLRELSFEDYFDCEDLPVRRFRAVYLGEGIE